MGFSSSMSPNSCFIKLTKFLCCGISQWFSDKNERKENSTSRKPTRFVNDASTACRLTKGKLQRLTDGKNQREVRSIEGMLFYRGNDPGDVHLRDERTSVTEE